MNTDQLIAFERVVREGSFSRAAWGLKIAQPTVSQRIRALEKELGGPLLVRNNRRVTLTQRGQNFLPFARQMLNAFHRSIDAAQSEGNFIHGELRVACLRSLTGGLLSPALQAFQQQNRSVFCYVNEGNQWQIVEWLHDGEVELGIIAWPNLSNQLSDVQALFEFSEPFDLMAHRSHPLAQLETVTHTDVAQLSRPFLHQRLWQVVPHLLTELIADAYEVIDVPSDAARLMLAAGSGAGFINRAQVLSGLLSAELTPITITDMPPLNRKSAVVKLTRGNHLSAAATSFLTHIKKQAQHLNLV